MARIIEDATVIVELSKAEAMAIVSLVENTDYEVSVAAGTQGLFEALEEHPIVADREASKHYIKPIA